MAEQAQQLITVKQLANRVGVEARVIRRILRSRFSREAKGKVYEWQPDDPQIELILKAVANHKHTETTQKPKAEKPKAKTVKPKATKVEAPTQGKVILGKPDPTTGGVPIDLANLPKLTNEKPKAIEAEQTKPKNSKPIRKTLAELQKAGVKVKPSAYAVYDEMTGEVEVIGGQEPKGETGA